MRLVRPTQEWALTLLTVALGATGCAHSRPGPSQPHSPRLTAILGNEAGQVNSPRLVPTSVSSSALRVRTTSPARGTERHIVSGVRIERHLGGGIATGGRLPQDPSVALEVPTRLGGGFLFALGGHAIARSDTWLGTPRQIFYSQGTIADLEFGLDRILVRYADGSREGIDPRSGERIGIGAFPVAPAVTQIVAVDAWRAIAIADLLGVLATFDAGATWTPIATPGRVRRVLARDDALHVESVDERGEKVDLEVRGPQSIVRSSAPAAESTVRGADDATQWLRLAVEEGWPLDRESALILHEGDLVRVDLSSGLVRERVPGALRSSDARCQALAIGREGNFGFACAERGGETALYTFERASGTVKPAGRWATPRVVLSSGNGLVTIKGTCTSNGPATPSTVCVRSQDGVFHEVQVPQDERTRFVAMSDGGWVVFQPPSTSTPGSLRVTQKGRTTTVPLNMGLVPFTMERSLRYGVWLDGFEERRAGVIGGWLNAGATMVGVEVSLDGTVLFGPPLEVGNAFVAGRFGSAWGYESTDGGMHWTTIDAPLTDPSISSTLGATSTRRACGPVGSLTREWLRVGWGAREPTPPLIVPEPPTAPTHRRTGLVALTCVAARKGSPPSALDAPIASVVPSLAKDDDILVLDGTSSLSRLVRGALVARIYAWRPKNGDASASKWMVRWTNGSDPRAKTSAITTLPRSIADLLLPHWGSVQRTFGFELLLANAAEDGHALLVLRQYGREDLLFDLDHGIAPAAILRADKEGFRDTSAAVHLLGQWYLATSTPESTAVWRAEATGAVPLLTLARAGTEFARSMVTLAANPAARSVGLIVDGSRTLGSRNPTPWLLPIPIDGGPPGAPFALPRFGEPDADSRACAADAEGFAGEIPWAMSPKLRFGEDDSGILTTSVRGVFLPDQSCMSSIRANLTQGGQVHPGRRPIVPLAPRIRLHVSGTERQLDYECAASSE